MVQRIGGFRRKTRHKFMKDAGKKGKIDLTRYFQDFKKGDRVHLVVESSIHKGIYHPRFMGKSGVITNKRGKCYEVSINDANKEKILIVHPIHMRKVQ